MTQVLDGYFEQAAARSPERIAILSEDGALSFGELERRARRLAGALRVRGVGPEARVGVCMRRTPDLVVALLGVLKAGGAYVPLDPAYPRKRIELLARDSGSLVLLADRGREPLAGSEAPVLRVADLLAEAGGSEGEAVPGPEPESLAYLIYTSGSTGVPKAVAIEHRSAVRLVEWATARFPVDDRDLVLASSSVCFDLSVFELFLPLSSGACLLLADDALALPGLPDGPWVSLLNTVPSICSELVRVDGLPESLDTVVLAGEPLHRPLVDRLHGLPGVCRVANLYGPSEDTTYSTAAELAADVGGTPTIGAPLPGKEAHLLDPRLRRAGDGEEGEICLSGWGVARGYVSRPASTAERFVPHPFSERPGGRLYRTGDLGRRTGGGELEFLGRMDHQVKLRGYRIELGEVEAALTELPEVAEAVAAVRERPNGDRALVGYVVPAERRSEPERLRRSLGERLPSFLVPGAFVILESLPRTPHGKVDRQGLPPLPEPRPDAEPRDEVEAGVARIWCELLGLERVGIHDHLFAELGGHSLLATRLISRLRTDLGVEIALTDVFEYPTVEEMASFVRAGGTRRSGVPPRPVPRTDELPLSFPQEQAWFIQHLEPSSIAYHFQSSLRFRGRLLVGSLVAALDELVRRHEILRTTFPAVDGRPVQRIHPPFRNELPVVDLNGLSEAVRVGELERRIADTLGRRFDLEELPLVRFALFRLGRRDHLLLHMEHHLVHDGWSYNVLLGELVALYRAIRSGSAPDLPPLALQFADFAAWQHRWLESEEAEEQRTYWRDRLAGDPPLLELAPDFPRPAVQTLRGAAVRQRLPVALCRRLRDVARGEGATLFMVLLAGFVALLHRYTGEEDLLIGSGVANRRWREVEGLIGMIVNTVVLRHRLAGDPGFRTLLGEVRRVTLEAYANQDLPFEELVRTLNPDRDPSRNPLFQVAFSFHDAPLADLSLPDLEVEVKEALSNRSAKFDLNVIVIPRSEQRRGQGGRSDDESIELIWEYSTDLYRGETVEAMAGHYERVLEDAVDRPEARVSELVLLDVEEEARLDRWNRTGAPRRLNRAVPLLIEEAAVARPDACAVSDGEATLSFGELLRRSTCLARELRAAGVGDGSVVGVSLERSAEMLVALLAVLRAGGAYLPLDARDPEKRRLAVLRDAGAAAVIARREDAKVAWSLGVPALTPEEGGAEDGDPGLGEAVEPSKESLAYVIYTSGSTGRPKGVEVSHGALLNFVDWFQRTYPVGPEDRVSQVSSLGFDGSILDIWPSWVGGAAIQVAAEEVRINAPVLAQWLERERITSCFLPTPLVEPVLAAASGPDLALEALIAGGDRLRWTPRPDVAFRMVNIYGPTETTVLATSTEVDTGVEGLPPIGRPISNARVYLLDRNLVRVPIGVPGEVWIGGSGLARGYRRLPALTADRFRPEPFALDGAVGSRLYRTGDLARLRPDGSLQFLGRTDWQVKLRGFRVEPGEVAATVAEQRDVREAVVVVRDDGFGARLVAYWVSDSPDRPGDDELRRYLGDRLPRYMLPSSYVWLERLPLTANGKVDRGALPLPSEVTSPSQPDGDPEAFATPTERLVAGVWRELLGVSQVTPEDDFFDLGGHSLLAIELVARLHGVLGVELPLVTVFRESSLTAMAEGVARRLEEGGGLQAALEESAAMTGDELDAALVREVGQSRGLGRGLVKSDLLAKLETLSPRQRRLLELRLERRGEQDRKRRTVVAIQGEGDRPPFFCVHSAPGSVGYFGALAERLGPQQPFFGIRAVGLDGDEAPLDRVESMAEQYVQAVCRTQPEGPYLLGGHSFGGLVALEMARRIHEEGGRVALLALLDTHLPGRDPTRGEEPDPEEEAVRWARLGRSMSLIVGRDLGVRLDDLRRRSSEEQLELVLDRVLSADAFREQFSRLPAATRRVVLRRILRVADACFRAGDRYRPRPYPGRVTLFEVEERWSGPSGPGRSPETAWRAVARGGLEVRRVSGDHASLMNEPHVDDLAASLKAALEAAS